MEHDPAIRVGSIVSVREPMWQHLPAYVGIVIHDSTYNPGFRKICMPGIGEVETALSKCYNATEAERKIYFKNVLKYGK